MRKEFTSGNLQIRAHAKLNFFFEILGKRPDGFHEVVTFMAPIELHDILEIAEEESGEIRFWCDDPTLPTGAENLVVQAARMMQQEAGKMVGARLRLFKRIPIQAGLGGGSSDAAATLKGLNRLWNLGFPREKLAGFASHLGSDVAFFLEEKASWCRGKGEQTEPYAGEIPPLSALIAQPPFGLSTPSVYGVPRPPFTPVLESSTKKALESGGCKEIQNSLFNRLEGSACKLEARLPLLLEALRTAGAEKPMLTGSGSAVFSLFESESEALATARTFLKIAVNQSYRIFLTRIVQPGPN